VFGTYRRLSCLSALELYRAGGSWIYEYRGQKLNRGEFFTNNVTMGDVCDIESAYVNVKFAYLQFFQDVKNIEYAVEWQDAE
jgi:hypothetical protein